MDETERCPLCHSVLEPTIEVENMYPDVKIKTRRMMLLSRIYLFVAIVAEAKTIVLTLIAILILIAIDFVSGYRGWSVRYVFPAAIILVDAGILILMCVNRRNWQSYIMWQIFMILCSFVPIILYLTGIIYVPYLALAALGTSVFLFLGTLIIGDRRARVELKRRFHIR